MSTMESWDVIVMEQALSAKSSNSLSRFWRKNGDDPPAQELSHPHQ